MSINDDKRYVDEIGTEVIVDCGRNITSAELLEIKVKKPDGTLATWTAEVYTANKTKIRYVTVAGDFDQSGQYEVQSHVKMSGWDGLGATAQFEVYDKFS